MSKFGLAFAGALAALALLSPVPARAAALIQPTLTFTQTGPVNYEHHSTTVVGKVIGKWPDGHKAPLAGLPIGISCYNLCTDGTLTTAADGTFALPVEPTWYENWATVSIAGTSTVAAYTTQTSVDPVTPRRIVASVAPTVGAQGTPVTVSGVLQYQGDKGWTALPKRTVSVHGIAAQRLVDTTTDETGHFTATGTIQAGPGESGGLEVTSEPAGVYFPYVASAELPFNGATTFNSFQVSYDPHGTLTVWGQLTPAGKGVVGTQVDLQYSHDGKSGWRTSRTLTVDTYGTISTRFFQGQSGYWRAVFPGNASATAVTSPIVKAWRWATRMVGFRVSPTQTSRGGSTVISGTLQRWMRCPEGSGQPPHYDGGVWKVCDFGSSEEKLLA